MSNPADAYHDWDVAYLLGSLSPAERREFENHLVSCPVCADNISALAGIPGVLSALSPAQAAELMDPVTTPATAVPRRLARRLAWAGWAAAGAAAGALAARWWWSKDS